MVSIRAEEQRPREINLSIKYDFPRDIYFMPKIWYNSVYKYNKCILKKINTKF